MLTLFVAEEAPPLPRGGRHDHPVLVLIDPWQHRETLGRGALLGCLVPLQAHHPCLHHDTKGKHKEDVLIISFGAPALQQMPLELCRHQQDGPAGRSIPQCLSETSVDERGCRGNQGLEPQAQGDTSPG